MRLTRSLRALGQMNPHRREGGGHSSAGKAVDLTGCVCPVPPPSRTRGSGGSWKYWIPASGGM